MRLRTIVLLGVLSVLCIGVFSAPVCVPTSIGVQYGPIDSNDSYFYEIAVQGDFGLRISVARTAAPVQIESVMVQPAKPTSDVRIISNATTCGVIGHLNFSIFARPDGSVFAGPVGRETLWAHRLAAFLTETRPANMCSSTIPGTCPGGGRPTSAHSSRFHAGSMAECCQACTEDPECTFWSFDTKPVMYNCYALAKVEILNMCYGYISGGITTKEVNYTMTSIYTPPGVEYYGHGLTDYHHKLSANNNFAHTADSDSLGVPSVWGSNGVRYLTVTKGGRKGATDPVGRAINEVSWLNPITSREQLMWYSRGSEQIDLYVLPAPTIMDGTSQLFRLTGAAKIPPLYVFGFIASSGSITNQSMLESTLTQFRSRNQPIDVIAADFPWFTSRNDTNFNISGDPTYNDFGYNSLMFPDPAVQLSKYHENYRVRFGGGRKSRLGNAHALLQAKEKGWLMPKTRNLDFSNPEVREWYVNNHQHYINDGVDFFWNNEGGSVDYFHYYHMNAAQLSLLRRQPDPALSNRRFFSLTDSYVPGMQALGGIAVRIPRREGRGRSYQLEAAAGYPLNYALAGAPYATSDYGFGNKDPTPLHVARVYQTSTFLPIMRISSEPGTGVPSLFPFDFEEPYASVMTKAIRLRYQLLPTIYSLAHELYLFGHIIARPIHTISPDNGCWGLDRSAPFLLGPSILVNPALRTDGEEYRPYIPTRNGTIAWYGFNTTHLFDKEDCTSVSYPTPLETIYVYVREGSIFGLALEGITSTHQLPGGPLELHVYPFRNAVAGGNVTWTMYEDDGISEAYTKHSEENPTVKKTVFVYDGVTRTVSWTVTAKPTDAQSHWFTSMYVKVFNSTFAQPLVSATVELRDKGEIVV